ncbi:MauE/DoxX family redox-associated membrane protein [uncultured Algibacter sp.]|uniref:heavy-metal-associated domain-containing protein n=1 Tax=uncultured Algibacter sp. TaxID=298659 RepID=UPI00321781C8
MKHIYIITGMTCNGCRTSVEKNLNAINGVIKASVDLEISEAIIEFKHPIPIASLQDALPNKYQISKKTETDKSVFNDATLKFSKKDKSELKQLFPLFLIFGYILIAVILMNRNSWNVKEAMLDFMGLFYMVFSFFKLLDLKGFPKSFKMYDPLAKVFPAYAWIYPFIELTLGLFFLMRIKIPLVLVITIIVLGITTFGVTKALLDKKSIQCACLGTALQLPMTKATFIENSIMMVMAIIMLVNMYI